MDKDDSAALDYGLQVAFLETGGIALVLAAGWLLSCLAETAAVAFTVFVARSCAGGAHCTGAGRCLAVTVLIFSLLGKCASSLAAVQSLDLPLYIVLVSLAALAVFVLRAPVDSPQKPINTAGHRRRLKALAVFALIALTVAQLLLLRLHGSWTSGTVIASSLGLLWEALILTKPGIALVSYLDMILAKIF